MPLRLAQEMLELSKEQKSELDKLQREVDEKLRKILNDQQKKKFDEMKNRLGGDRPPRPPGAPRD